ncbi:MAG: hypothetical protein IKM53_04615 [Clostridia bacterium]|nr:hypothetical protein [Clostridia bacterium]
MKTNRKQVLALLLSVVLVLGIFPARAIELTVTAAPKLEDGTVIYYEDFNYANNTNKSSVLSTLGWTVSNELRTNKVNYSISDGKLLCDSIAGGATGDSYVTILDNTAMSEVSKSDYTITYKLKYVEADSYTRYNAVIHNYNGYKSYNSVHLRIGGYGNNQVRCSGNWYDYESSSSGYYLKSTGTSSVSYKLFGVQSASANASSNTGYPMVGKDVTIRIAVDLDGGSTVYINDVKMSTTVQNKELFSSSLAYAQAIALKTSRGTKAYIDDFMVYVGTGKAPANITKEDITYKLPVSEDYGTQLKVMSLNSLFSDQTLDVFGDGMTRATHMYNVVSGFRPDIVGFQERSSTNRTTITSVIAADAGYAVVDDYRTDTTVANVTTMVPILYSTTRFTLVENAASNNNIAHGALLFNDSYNVIGMTASQKASYEGTKGLSWAVLKDKQTGGYVLALNTHFALRLDSYADSYTSADAVEDRIGNANQAFEIMDKVYAVFGIIPTVFTGDFNMRLNDQSYKLLSTRFEDTIYANSDFVKYEYTMSDINNPDAYKAPNAPIDHLFYTSENLTPISYTVCKQSREIRAVSDHIPVIGVYKVADTFAPQCSHSTGIYSGTQNVTLSGTGEIYYTDDNTDPRTSLTRKLYPGVITVTEDAVIKFCSKLGGEYSPVERVTLFFGTPLYITEAIKNGPGSDLYEGIEIINVSGVPVDLSDFYIYYYNSTDEATSKAFDPAKASSQMKMAYTEGESVVPSGAVAYCPIISGAAYLNKDVISAGKSAYLVTLNEDGTKVTYHKDRFASIISYDKAGSIAPELVLPIDRTARSIGYTDEGVAVRRYDYYNSSDGSANNTSSSFGFGNSGFTNLYINFRTSTTAGSAFCAVHLDSTDDGTVVAEDGTTSCRAGSYNFLPTSTATMITDSFTSVTYTIGYLTAEQQTAFDALIAKRLKTINSTSQAINNASEFAAMTATGSYYLANDITIDTTYTQKFKGILDGRGHTVTTSVPLFTDLSGTVRNLNVKGEVVGNADTDNGAVAITTTGNARFEKVIVNANVSGGNRSGALLGYGINGSSVIAINCINNGSISGNGSSGGFIGYIEGTTLYLDGCINNGSVNSDNNSAGFVGRFGLNQATTKHICYITNCDNYGEIISSGSRAAGIIAYSAGIVTIAGCSNYGRIAYSGTPVNFFAGGIYGVGSATYTAEDSTTVDTITALTIRECYNHGDVEATTGAGGIVARISTVKPASGYNYTISDCGNTGDISTFDCGSTYGTKGAAGIIGYMLGNAGNSIVRCYNVGNITSTNTSNTVPHRPSGIVSYVNSKEMVLKHCYSAGTVTGIGDYATPYQLYYNNNSTGASADYMSNNHALAVSGATYEVNGSQSTASYKTFTSAQLTNGTLRNTINSAAGDTYYYQYTAKETYPVLTEYNAVTKYGIVLSEDSDYSENETTVYRVAANTDVESFSDQFIFDVWVCKDDTVLSLTQKMATGYKVTSFDGTEELTVAVIGDIDSDSILSSTDCASLKNKLRGFSELGELQNLAADFDGNGTLNTFDYLRLKLAVKGA